MNHRSFYFVEGQFAGRLDARLARRAMEIIALFVCIGVQGCAGNIRYQFGSNPLFPDSWPAPPSRDCGAATPQSAFGAPVPIYPVEFDDQGVMWDPEQFNNALRAITAHPRSESIIVVSFIHGWQHNADSNDEDLQQFQAELRHREALEENWAEWSNRPARPILGIYIGWRGKSLYFDPYVGKNSTFWSRKAAAMRVGGTAMTEVVFGIAKVVKERNPKSQTVFVGHSFGGAILEEALAQAFVGLLSQPRPSATDEGSSAAEIFHSPIDLAVLVNPAAPALNTYQLVDTLMRRQVFISRDASGKEAPLLVSITSASDSATGEAFPLGQKPIAVTKKFRPIKYEGYKGPSDEESLFLHTAGHTPELYSHWLRPLPSSDRES